MRFILWFLGFVFLPYITIPYFMYKVLYRKDNDIKRF